MGTERTRCFQGIWYIISPELSGIWCMGIYYSCLRYKHYDFLKCIIIFTSLNWRKEGSYSPEMVQEWVVLNTNHLPGIHSPVGPGPGLTFHSHCPYPNPPPCQTGLLTVFWGPSEPHTSAYQPGREAFATESYVLKPTESLSLSPYRPSHKECWQEKCLWIHYPMQCLLSPSSATWCPSIINT